MSIVPVSGFWVALANADGSRSSLATELYPSPTTVDYPGTPAGEIIETADGRAVMQQPTYDSRRRSWVWRNFRPTVLTYERQFKWLQGLRSRERQARGHSPYVYVYDGTTGLLNRRRELVTTGTVSGSALTVPNFSATVHPDVLRNATVEIFATGGTNPIQRVPITQATATTIQCSAPLDTLGAVDVRVYWDEPHWWRVRVLDAMRTPQTESGNVRYPESKFVFVIEDDEWNNLG